jgi:hypothetical protein
MNKEHKTLVTFDLLKKYVVVCKNYEIAQKIAANAYSLDGIKYLRINKCGRTNVKNPIILTPEEFIKTFGE